MEFKELIDIVSMEMGVDITSRCRDSEHAIGRAVYYDIAYNKLKMGSMNAIGRSIGRTHATVINALNNILPDIKTYYSSMHDRRISLIRKLNLDEDEINQPIQDAYDKMKVKYVQLKNEYDEVCKNLYLLNTDDDDDLDELISNIRRVPSDKLSILKLRVNAIIKMI